MRRAEALGGEDTEQRKSGRAGQKALLKIKRK